MKFIYQVVLNGWHTDVLVVRARDNDPEIQRYYGYVADKQCSIMPVNNSTGIYVSDTLLDEDTREKVFDSIEDNLTDLIISKVS